MTEREKFEAWWEEWFGDKPLSGWESLRCDNGYAAEEIDNMWDAWRAATASTQEQMAALAAKGIELAAEAAMVYGKYNETQVPDRDLVDMQTIQEMHDLCAGIKLQIEE